MNWRTCALIQQEVFGRCDRKDVCTTLAETPRLSHGLLVLTCVLHPPPTPPSLSPSIMPPSLHPGQRWCCFSVYFVNEGASFVLHPSFLFVMKVQKHVFSDRDGSLMTHKESPPAKNSFLEDLDKLEVSGPRSAEQLRAGAIFSGRCYQKDGCSDLKQFWSSQLFLSSDPGRSRSVLVPTWLLR